MIKFRRTLLLSLFMICWIPTIGAAADLGVIIDFGLREFASRLQLDLNLLSGAQQITEISPGVYRLHFRHQPDSYPDSYHDYQADIDIVEQPDGSLQLKSAVLDRYNLDPDGVYPLKRTHTELNYFYGDTGLLENVHIQNHVNNLDNDATLLENTEFDEHHFFDPEEGNIIESRYEVGDFYDYVRRTLTTMFPYGDNYDRVWLNTGIPLKASWRDYFVLDLDTNETLKHITSVQSSIGSDIETHDINILDFVKGFRLFGGSSPLGGPFEGEQDIQIYRDGVLWDEQTLREVHNLAGSNDKSDNNFLGIYKLNKFYNSLSGELEEQKFQLVLDREVYPDNLYEHLIEFRYTVADGVVTGTRLDSSFLPQAHKLYTVFDTNYELAPEDILYSLKYMVLLPGVETWRSAPGLRGDLNGDGRVGLSDLASLQTSFDTNWFNNDNFNPAADFDHDLVISSSDLAILARNFGATTETRLSYAGVLTASLGGYRGADLNGDEVIDRGDVDWLENRLFMHPGDPLIGEADLNEDGQIDIEDFNQLIYFVERLSVLQAAIPRDVQSPEAEALRLAAERNEMIRQQLAQKANLYPQDPVLNIQAPGAKN